MKYKKEVLKKIIKKKFFFEIYSNILDPVVCVGRVRNYHYYLLDPIVNERERMGEKKNVKA